MKINKHVKDAILAIILLEVTIILASTFIVLAWFLFGTDPVGWVDFVYIYKKLSKVSILILSLPLSGFIVKMIFEAWWKYVDDEEEDDEEDEEDEDEFEEFNEGEKRR